MADKRPEKKLEKKLRKQKGHKYDFAFILHPLEFEHIINGIPIVRLMRKIIPDSIIEKVLCYMPGFLLGTIDNVVSSHTKKKTNGLVYALAMTPKMLKTLPTEVVYKRILNTINNAKEKGAKVVGLGAYLKVIGDAGKTINKRSPLPVTTGNSLTIGATIWGLNEAIKQMKLVKMNQATGVYDGTAMVVGATGAIGSACAQILSKKFKRVCLVAPNPDSLAKITNKIRSQSPSCEILCSTNSDDLTATSDIIVISTSTFSGKVLDINKVKPGCVISDCSRPQNISKQEISSRPDVLFMESGDLSLPSGYDLNCYLPFPYNVLPACLVETITLAMDNRYEAFTLGRDVDSARIDEILGIGKKHGVDLAPLRSSFGFLEDKAIPLIKKNMPIRA